MSKPKKSWANGFLRWLRLQLLKLVRENSTPARTGLGFALGSFIGIFPSFLVGTPVAFLLAGRFGWNRAAAVAGTFLTNPVTAPIYYWLSTKLGLEILGWQAEMVRVEGMLNYLRHFGLAFLVGNTVFGLIFASVVGIILFLLMRKIGRAGVRRMLFRPREHFSPPPTSGPAV